MKEFSGTDPEAKIILNGSTVTVSFRFDNNLRAAQFLDELLASYHDGEPVTITLSKPAELQ